MQKKERWANNFMSLKTNGLLGKLDWYSAPHGSEKRSRFFPSNSWMTFQSIHQGDLAHSSLHSEGHRLHWNRNFIALCLDEDWHQTSCLERLRNLLMQLGIRLATTKGNISSPCPHYLITWWCNNRRTRWRSEDTGKHRKWNRRCQADVLLWWTRPIPLSCYGLEGQL